MTNTEILKCFYAAMENHDWQAKRRLMHDDYAFRGPRMTADSADQFIANLQEMNCAMKFSDVTMAEDGDTVLSFFTCTMAQPAQMSFRCAERATFSGGRLKSAELLYDASAFPSMG